MNFRFIFCFIFLAVNSYGATVPSLHIDCDIKSYLELRMSEERESFWTRSSSQECHDLEGERFYDEKLSVQIVACYDNFRQDFATCDFSKFHFDENRANVVMPSSEYYRWSMARDLGENLVHPAKFAYMQDMGRWLTSCFTVTNLVNLNATEFMEIYKAAETLSDARRDYSEKPIFDFGTTSSSGSRYYSVYSVKLNGVVARYTNHDGDKKIIVKQEDPVHN